VSRATVRVSSEFSASRISTSRIEKEVVSGFYFFGGWNLALGSGKTRLPEKKLRFEDQELGA
jgi:hypothetical protein